MNVKYVTHCILNSNQLSCKIKAFHFCACIQIFFIKLPRSGQHLSHLMTKLTKWSMCPLKTQISLGICPVWSESLLCAQWVAEDSSFLQVDSEDSDQADPSLRWAHMPFCWFCHEAAHFDKIPGYNWNFNRLPSWQIVLQTEFIIGYLLGKLFCKQNSSVFRIKRENLSLGFVTK